MDELKLDNEMKQFSFTYSLRTEDGGDLVWGARMDHYMKTGK